MRRPKNSHRMLALVLGAVLAATTIAVAQAPPSPSAFKGPLASKAPLLALTRIGPRLVAVGDYGVVLLSDDSGATWRQAGSVATRTMLTAVTFVDPMHGWATGHGGEILKTEDGGENWMPLYSAGKEVVLLSLWFENAQHGIAVGAFGFAIETRDGGHSWKEIVIGEGDDRDRHLNAIFALPGGTLIVAAEAGTAFRSTDGGATWATLRLPYNGSMWGGIPLANGAALLFGMRGHALYSADAGRTWTEAATGADHSFTGGLELPDGTVVLVGLSGVLARSADGGKTFAATIRPERQTMSAVGAGTSGQLVGVGTGGIATFPVK